MRAYVRLFSTDQKIADRRNVASILTRGSSVASHSDSTHCLGNGDGFGGPWPNGGTQFAMADGSVRLLRDDIDPKVLRALATPAGGEEVAGETDASR